TSHDGRILRMFIDFGVSSGWRGRSMSGKLAQCEYGMAKRLQPASPTPGRKIPDKGAADDRTTGDADETQRRFGGAACRNEVVDEQHPLPALHCIPVDLEAVGAIFQLVVLAKVFGWQLTLFADGHEAGSQLVRDRAADDE